MSLGKVLVTGAGGLLGGYVVRELAARATVAGLDLAEPGKIGTATISRPDDAKDIAQPRNGGCPDFFRGSIEDPAAVARAMQGQDMVVHIAARPNIWAGAGHEIIHTNVTGTWNVLEAAEKAGVRRVVVTSSDSVVGYTVAEGSMLPPDYIPIDAEHPLRPTEAYGVSKKLCEGIARAFADRGRLEVVVLRPVYVLYPEFECEVLARAADPANYKGPMAGGRQPAGGGPAWNYVDPRDLARAYRLALEAPKPGFGPYFICGPTTLTPEPTIERLAARMGRRVPVRRPEVYAANPYAPLYDLAGARDGLGFVAGHDRRTLVDRGSSR